MYYSIHNHIIIIYNPPKQIPAPKPRPWKLFLACEVPKSAAGQQGDGGGLGPSSWGRFHEELVI